MLTEVEHEGLWHLAQSPEKSLAGKLTFNPSDGATLALIGSFTEEGPAEPDIILGTTTGGKLVTLYRCLHRGTRQGSPGNVSASSFYAHVVFIGAHFPNPEEISFHSMSMRFTHLDLWAMHSNLRPFRIDTSNIASGVVTISSSTAKKIKLASLRDRDVFLDVEGGLSVSGVYELETVLRQRSFVKIEHSGEDGFHSYADLFHRLGNFITLAIGVPVRPEALYGTLNDRDRTKRVDVYYRQHAAPSSERRPSPNEILFRPSEGIDRITDLLQEWLNKAGLLEPAHNSYFSTRYRDDLFAEHKFLSLVQGLEIFHSRTRDNYVLPCAEHRKRMSAILGSVDGEHRDWLNSKLEFSNQPSLRQRLKQLLLDCSSAASDLVDDQKAFVHTIVSTRNYLTHYNPKLAEHAAVGEQLYHISEKLMLLLEMCFLLDIGISPSEVQAMMRRNRRYQTEVKRR